MQIYQHSDVVKFLKRKYLSWFNPHTAKVVYICRLSKGQKEKPYFPLFMKSNIWRVLYTTEATVKNILIVTKKHNFCKV